MILTFQELGIKVGDYTGMHYSMAHALVVNEACDYLRIHQDAPGMDDATYFGDFESAFTNFILQTVYVPTIWDVAPHNASMDGWTAPRHTLH